MKGQTLHGRTVALVENESPHVYGQCSDEENTRVVVEARRAVVAVIELE